MLTADVFAKAGFPVRASAIRRNGSEWLARESAMVREWARQCFVDITEALKIDLCEYDPQIPLRGEPVRVDVVIPFCDRDSQYLAECVRSIAGQRHCIPTIHLIADGCEYPELPELRPAITVHCYQTPGGWGPYKITNAVVQGGNCGTEYLAIQDADDISRPDRLWRQVQTLRHYGAEMISSAMRNFLQDSELEFRQRGEPIIRPGKVYSTVPRGRCVNSTRTMTLDLFTRLNGFGDLRCTGDFQFDNRCRFAGIKIIDDQKILGDRRLHTESMTGGRFLPGTNVRETDVAKTNHARDMLQQTPTEAMAAELGALQLTPGLRNRYLKSQ